MLMSSGKALVLCCLLSLVAVTLSAAPIDFTGSATLGSLTGGADPFFWENIPVVMQGSVDSAATPVSCGGTCVSYSATSMNLLMNGSLLFAVANPTITIVAADGSPAIFQLNGQIFVDGQFLTAISFSLGLPTGVLDSGALLAPPVFGPAAIDAATSSFFYQIIAGGPAVAGSFAVDSEESGFAVASRASAEIPEPGTVSMFGLGLGLVALASRFKRRTRAS